MRPTPQLLALLVACVLTSCARKPDEKPIAETSLNTSPVSQADPPQVIQQLEERGVVLTKDQTGRVTKADARNAHFTDADIPLLTDLSHLQSLNLDSAPITDAAIATLKSIPSLTELNLRRCAQLTDACAPLIAALPKLERLQLHFTLLTNDAVQGLADCQQLRLLDLRGCKRINDAGVAHLATLTKLVDLKLSNYDITSASLKSLSGLSQLRALSLEGCSVDDSGLQHLSGLTQLALLNLDQTQVSDVGLAHISKLPLRELSGLGTVILGPGLEKLQAARETLIALDLSETSLEDDGLKSISQFSRLQRLTLIRGDYTDAGLAALLPLKDLQVLNVSESHQLTPAAATTLGRFTKLRTLRVSSTRVDDSLFAALAPLSELAELNVSATGVTPAGAEAFEKSHPECRITR